MELYANRDFGRLVGGIIRGRILETGVQPVEFRVDVLGEFLNKLAKLMRRHMVIYYGGDTHKVMMQYLQKDIQDPGLKFSIGWDPTMQLGLRTFLMMVWTSLLVPRTYHKAQQVIPHLDEFFETFHYRRLTDEEMEYLSAEITRLMEKPCPAGAMNAGASALLSAVNRPLKGVSAGRSDAQQERRRIFLATARELCLAIEAATDLPHRKNLTSNLGELLVAELRASDAQGISSSVDMFWEESELFFSGSRLAW